jgi:hypothetical protein
LKSNRVGRVGRPGDYSGREAGNRGQRTGVKAYVSVDGGLPGQVLDLGVGQDREVRGSAQANGRDYRGVCGATCHRADRDDERDADRRDDYVRVLHAGRSLARAHARRVCLRWIVDRVIVRVMTVRSLDMQEPRTGLLDRDQVPKRVIVDNEEEEGSKQREAQERPQQWLCARPQRIGPARAA